MTVLLLFFLSAGGVWGSPNAPFSEGTTKALSSLLQRMDTLETLLNEQDTKLAYQQRLLLTQHKRLSDQERLLQDQTKTIANQAGLLQDQTKTIADQAELLQDQTKTIADQAELLQHLNDKVSEQESLNHQHEALLSLQNTELGQQRDVLHTLLAVDVRCAEGVRETEELQSVVSSWTVNTDIPDHNSSDTHSDTPDSQPHDVHVRSDDVAPLEAVVSQLSQKVTEMSADIQTLQTSNIQQDHDIQDASSSTFVHWGSSQCSNASQLGVLRGGGRIFISAHRGS